MREVMFALRTDLIRNIANIAKSQLHEHYYEVPAPIREYIQEVKAQLALLTGGLRGWWRIKGPVHGLPVSLGSSCLKSAGLTAPCWPVSWAADA